jgi:hypothetical protein
MEFSMNLLGTVALCDSALLNANKAQNDLEFELEGLNRSYQDAIDDDVQAQTDLQLAESDLVSTNLSIEALPPGELENDLIERRMKLELKIFKLRNKMNNQGGLNLIQRQYNIIKAEHEMAINATLIDLLMARKAELESSTAA